MSARLKQRGALNFVVLLGVVSLFADVTYEGARSITGPYLAVLGASATVVGVVSGFGELLGYGLRLFSGYLSDKTGKYWLFTITGYAVNLLAVPFLALTHHWPAAACLIVTERIGKAIRTPARDAMLAQASKEMGHGKGFGIHEALDQIGALTGPLVVTAVLFISGSYQRSFAVLLVPALLALIVLALTRFYYSSPPDFETKETQSAFSGFSRDYWIYLIGVAFIAAGYADFPLIAFHFEKTRDIPRVWIPAFYSVAMAADAVAALYFGYWFDRRGVSVMIFAAFLSIFFAPFVFFGNFWMALFGMALWGLGMGAHESVMRAAVSRMTPSEFRGRAFGVFHTGYGLFWFLGSAVMGFLYDRSVSAIVIFSVVIQSISLPFLWAVSKKGDVA